MPSDYKVFVCMFVGERGELGSLSESVIQRYQKNDFCHTVDDFQNRI